MANDTQSQPNMAEIMSDPEKASEFFAQMPEEFWLQKGSVAALNVFKGTADSVSAYQDFLKSNKISADEVTTHDDFKTLPCTSKENYLDKYSYTDVIFGNRAESCYWISKSSGSTGKARYWPRLKNQDVFSGSLVEIIYNLMGIQDKSVLIINCLSLGSWVAGIFMSTTSLQIANGADKKISVIIPGAKVNEIIETVKEMGPLYDRILFIGYPPLIRNVITLGEEEGIVWSKYKPVFFVGGEPVSMSWKQYIQDKIDSVKLMDLMGVYGMSEIGVLAFETPIASLMRKILVENKGLATELFGENKINTLMQYNPMSRWIEEINGELVITAMSGIPIVRYNSHDLGGVYTFSQLVEKFDHAGFDLKKLLKDEGYNPDEMWRWPFFYSYGRGGGSVALMGSNIYTENISEYITGSSVFNDFKMSIEHDDLQNSKLCVFLELNEHKKKSSADLKTLEKTALNKITKLLLKNNKDFAADYQEDPAQMTPKIVIYPYGSGPFDHKAIKQSHIK